MQSDRDIGPGGGNQLGIIYGAEEIAVYLGMTRRQVYHACERHSMPYFRIGAIICARRATLARWIDAQEIMTASTVNVRRIEHGVAGSPAGG